MAVTVFVNPLQFGPHEDLSRYPRDLEGDVSLARSTGAGYLFAPSNGEMYPRPPLTRVTVAGMEGLEAESRPGHLDGVATVVTKLLALTGPCRAYFGEKDYQQLVLIRRMAHDLDLQPAVIGVPTVREPDGLAVSSRNRYLTATERSSAVALSAGLFAGAAAATAGAGAGGVVTAARRVLDAAPGVTVDYLELRAPDLGDAPASGAARLLVAARVGATRLIDNVPVQLRARHPGEP